MELFILFGYVIPALIVVIIGVQEARRVGQLTITDILCTVLAVVIPIFNILTIVVFASTKGWGDKVLWIKKR
jgi:hypothetical protein